MKKTLGWLLAVTTAGTGLPAHSEGGSKEQPDSRAITRSGDQGNLEEVLVTAQKRTERLQDVPASISVISGGELDTSTAEGITEALNRTPGVMAQTSYIGGGTQIAVRGVAASSTILHGSSPIAYYLDSVPFGLIKTSIAPDANAFDLERVEVLRGPQGTLYGASALNGVVRVLTKDAGLDRFELKARTSASATEGGGENYRADMALNVPLIDGKLAVRAAGGYEDLSGWIDRPNRRNANDAELRNLRLKVNAQPTDELSIGLSTWISRSDFGAPSLADDQGRHSSINDEPVRTDYDAYSLKVSYDFGSFLVTSMSSYLDYENDGSLDLVPFIGVDVPFVNQFAAEVFSEEVVVTSSGDGPWRWSLGGMFRDEEDQLFQTITGLIPMVDYTDSSESMAVFGELTRVFNDGRFELTAGLRYFEDDVGTEENVPSSGVLTDPLLRVSSDFDAVTPRLVFAWLPTDQLTVYASYSEGFRSGFQQQPIVLLTAPRIPPVDADTLNNYEVGTKGSVLDGSVKFEAAVYYIDWRDVQRDESVVINSVPIAALVNGESASGVGFEFAINSEPVSGLELGVSFSWNDLAWDDDVFSGGGILFEKGDRLSLSPEIVAGASAAYSFPLNERGVEGRFAASANYTSEQDLEIATGRGEGDAILIARTHFAVDFPERWSAMLYVDNVTNEDGAVLSAPFPVPEWSTRPRPRTFGLQLEYHF
jgi:outer membrane receptor protein involved in Fe transport